MPATLEAESTLNDRHQTTVPETVRRALRLGKRDKIHYTIRPNGEVVLVRRQHKLTPWRHEELTPCRQLQEVSWKAETSSIATSEFAGGRRC